MITTGTSVFTRTVNNSTNKTVLCSCFYIVFFLISIKHKQRNECLGHTRHKPSLKSSIDVGASAGSWCATLSCQRKEMFCFYSDFSIKYKIKTNAMCCCRFEKSIGILTDCIDQQKTQYIWIKKEGSNDLNFTAFYSLEIQNNYHHHKNNNLIINMWGMFNQP